MPLIATRLRCNLLIDPLAVAEAHPRLSWVLEGDGQRQTAYEVETEYSDGSRHTTGRVASAQTFDVLYAGRPLAARETARWRVRVWDENGIDDDWSEWAQWTAAPAKWEAEFIGFDAPLDAFRPPDFMGAYWIWHPDGPLDPVPVSTARFRKTFRVLELPTEAQLLITGDDSYHAFINGTDVGKSDGNPDSWRRPGLHDVRQALKVGENTIEVVVGSIGRSISGLIAKLEMSHGGMRSAVVTGPTWEARWEEGNDWKPVRELGENGAPPWGGLPMPHLFLPPPRVFARTFTVGKPVRRAVLYATALGVFKAEVNGTPIALDFFAPGWTDYKKRLHYRAFDVTEQIVQGENETTATVADGWFAGYVGFGRRHHYGEATRYSAMLWIDYQDGTSERIATDDHWRGATGPITQSDFLMGESYDARITDLDWHPVVLGKEVEPVLEPYPMQPTGVCGWYEPASVTKAPNGDWLFDLGANFAGIVSLDPSHLPEGTTVTIHHAEVLQNDGNVYLTNLRSARAVDKYTATSPSEPIWQPVGTFHGFRYASVLGLDQEPPKELISGVPLSNVTRSAAKFECSDPRLNTLWQNIDRTFRSNFIEVPTDCPQRDERLGWTGDIQVFCRTAMVLADVQAFLDKWLVDLTDAQRADGQYPMVAPVVYDLSDGGPAWADAGTIVPWAMWEVYGDKRVLERQFESMKKFVGFCVGRMEDMLPPKEFHCFGDWLNVGVETPTPVLYQLFAARSAWILAQTARILGKNEVAEKNESLFKMLALRFRARFLGDDGWVEGKSQTGQVLALAFGVVEGEQADQVFARLAEDVERRGHLTTGFVGTKDLMLVLRDFGRTDLAYKLLLREDYPGWLFSIKHGATSIWERWDGWTPEKGFQDAGMNSFAHYAFGAVGQFMMETIGGIRPLEPGYGRVQIHVERGPLEWANCSYHSPRGEIATVWDRDRLIVTIPPNVVGQVRLPSGETTLTAGTHELRF